MGWTQPNKTAGDGMNEVKRYKRGSTQVTIYRQGRYKYASVSLAGGKPFYSGPYGPTERNRVIARKVVRNEGLDW